MPISPIHYSAMVCKPRNQILNTGLYSTISATAAHIAVSLDLATLLRALGEVAL